VFIEFCAHIRIDCPRFSCIRTLADLRDVAY
jgi:hypothetical protein